MKRISATVFVAMLCGCADEEVRTHIVQKPADPSVRMLAVIVPQKDATWFFKLSGPAAAVAAEEPAFRKLVESVKFQTTEPPVSWTTPEGWTPGPTKRERYATLRTPSGIETTVTNLGPGQDVAKNVNRWRGQIGLTPADSAEMTKITRNQKIGDVDATWVDLVNPGLPPLPFTPSRPVASESDKSTTTKLAYQIPSGWESRPASSVPFAVAVFRAGTGDDAVDISVSPLGGGSGGLGANVNRWRTQVGLTAQDEKAVRESAKELIIEGKPAPYFDLLGPEGGARKRILGAIAERGATTWFIKLRGPAEAVARQQSAFESFVRSLKLPDEANGG